MKGKKMKKASGGKVEAEAKSKTEGFKRGGKVKGAKIVGKVHGKMSKHRLDKKARGGSVKGGGMSAGAPMSSAGATKGNPSPVKLDKEND